MSISIDEMRKILRSLGIKAAEYTDCAILYEASFDQLQAICNAWAAELLQQHPAPVPDTRVASNPSDEWDALVERAWDKYETVGYQGERFMYCSDFGSAMDLVRKEFARWGHWPAPPAEGEVAELVEILTSITERTELDPFLIQRFTRIAALLQQQQAEIKRLKAQQEPVSASEQTWREGGWLDPDGECWWCPQEGPPRWTMVNPAWVHGGWLLPAHALPVPGTSEQPNDEEETQYDRDMADYDHNPALTAEQRNSWTRA